MGKEIEIKLKYFDREKVSEKLKKMGARLIEKYELEDSYFALSHADMSNAHDLVRVRKKGSKIELTYKGKSEFSGNIWKRDEINIGIDNFNSMVDVLKKLGFNFLSENKSVREVWDLNGVEILFCDIILPAKINYIEIEGPTEERLREVVNKLGNVVAEAGEEIFNILDEANNRKKDKIKQMKIDRAKLPFRKNCEGYFIDGKGNVLAKDSGKGFLAFPGGGVDDSEEVEKAIVRETIEETGAVIQNLKKIGNLKFIWGPTWAKTEKQKKRYEQYKGEDMHFFFGKIEKFVEPEKIEEDFWQGEKLISIKKAIEIIELSRPFDAKIKEYREMQLKSLKNIQNEEI